ncbi:MAG: PilZ domain-containing protein [Thermodesulfovibrionales bacterium]|nr:PilZ domain-containing protein [Thermodesulfovibrionales bacterium]
MLEENRKEQRIQATGGILYVTPSLESSTKIRSGLVCNVSNSGACIYIQDCIKETETIKIYFREISASPMEASVRWCARDKGDLFRVGLLLNN